MRQIELGPRTCHRRPEYQLGRLLSTSRAVEPSAQATMGSELSRTAIAIVVQAAIATALLAGCSAPATTPTTGPASPSPELRATAIPTVTASRTISPSPSAKPARWKPCTTVNREAIEPPEAQALTTVEELLITQHVELPAYPLFLTYGADSVWVSGVAGELWRVDPHTGEQLSELEIGTPEPAWLAFGHGTLWFGRMSDGVVVRIDPVTELPVARIQLQPSDRPMTIAVDESVWVANQLQGTVTRIDPASNEILETIALGRGGPFDAGPSGVAVLGKQVFISEHRSDTVARLDIGSGEVSRSCLGTPNPGRIAVTKGDVWIAEIGIAEIGGLLTRVDPVALEVRARLELPSAVVGGLAASGRRLWVANGSHVVALDTETGTAGSVELPAQRAGVDFPGGLGIAVSGDVAWTTDTATSGLLRIETAGR